MNQHQRSIKVVNKVMNLVLKEVELLNEQNIKSILEGTIIPKLSLHPKNSKQLNNQIKNLPKKEESQKIENQKTRDSIDISSPKTTNITEIAERLKQLNNREEGVKILENFCTTKKDLENLATHLGLSNTQKYTKQILQDRIIERTIGYRLRSRAVRGEPTSIPTEESDTETTQSVSTDSVQGKPTSITTE